MVLRRSRFVRTRDRKAVEWTCQAMHRIVCSLHRAIAESLKTRRPGRKSAGQFGDSKLPNGALELIEKFD